MALTLDSIYKPINDFFISLYQTDTESPLLFRFDKFGSVISDGDFMGISQDNPGLITERFSDLVNRLPVEDNDGLNILFTANTLDDIYFYQLLNQSIPFAKDDDPDKENIMNAVSKIISDAKNEYEKSSLARQGVASLFRASYASPGDWYNSTDNAIWTSHSFGVGETAPTTDDQSQPKPGLWRLKINNAALENILAIKSSDPVKPAELYNKVLLMRKSPALATIKMAEPIHAGVSARSPVRMASSPIIRDHRSQGTGTIVRDHRDEKADGTNYTALGSVQRAISGLNLKQRYIVNQHIKINAPTEPATTNNITISFDYCKVDIRRPWLFNVFLQNGSWFIPGMKKGQLSAPDADTELSFLPISFIAVKNLSIKANWSVTDVTNSNEATDFGPFEVNGGIVNNTLSHEGIQIIGWMLQQMRDLPPNDAP
jgi:hypothetical protein